MKNNQFAIVSNNLKTKKLELAKLNFLDSDTEKIDKPCTLLKEFLLKAFLDTQSNAIKGQKISAILASEDEDALSYLDDNEPLSKIAFYNIALQLLGFQVGLDFEIDDSISKMKEWNLPIDKSKDPMSTDEVISAWYLLLNTHNKYGQTYIDYLASTGYFAQNYNKFDKPLIFNGKSMPAYDTNELIREVVYVESPQDTDFDGKLDLLKVEVLRPKESNKNQVPVLFTASPYNQGTNDYSGEKLTHEVNVPLKHKEPVQYKYDQIKFKDEKKALPAQRTVEGITRKAEQTFDREASYTLNDYFLARGFAVVYSAGIGTKESDGLRTTGSPEETIATTSVIEWLAGNRTAFTNKVDNTEIKAWWSNGNIAMTGRSYLGTLQTAAATTGVEGLKTCISEAAISSWYDYYRDNGLVVAPGGFQGEDADVLAEETFSRQQEAGDYMKVKDQWLKQLKQITKYQDRETGNYNTFWDARNYLNNIKNIKADMVMVHGLNDWNVKPRNVENLWQALKKVPVEKKLFLHQGQHIYINAFQSIDFTDMMNLWLTNKLLGVENNANELIPDVTIQDNVKPETWNTYEDWANADENIEYCLGHDNSLTDVANDGQLSFNDHLETNTFEKYTQNYTKWRKDLLTDQSAMQNNRLIFKTKPLTQDTIIDGKVNVKVKAASDQNFGMLSFMLVDYGTAKRLTETPQSIEYKRINEGFLWREDSLREFKLQKNTTDYKKITEGHINLQNRTNNYSVDDMEANTFYDVEMELQPTFYHLVKGHQIGLVVYATDFEMTNRGNQDVNYSIDLKESSIEIPIFEK
ncbi:Xaa-Pro dipeptidyl-peptidase [Apilactobacillus xinyiensis]|uniref:Xaa-Pro dipeptidyl-peptidase n=1 Tax=Apilactobacillus xinyiensis TaxID=2841032 RepID=UPI003364BE95